MFVPKRNRTFENQTLFLQKLKSELIKSAHLYHKSKQPRKVFGDGNMTLSLLITINVACYYLSSSSNWTFLHHDRHKRAFSVTLFCFFVCFVPGLCKRGIFHSTDTKDSLKVKDISVVYWYSRSFLCSSWFFLGTATKYQRWKNSKTLPWRWKWIFLRQLDIPHKMLVQWLFSYFWL